MTQLASERSRGVTALGALGLVFSAAGVLLLLEPVFREANCYSALAGVDLRATLAFFMSFASAVSLGYCSRKAAFIWPAGLIIGVGAGILVVGMLLFGPLSLVPEWGGNCSQDAGTIYARLSWVLVPSLCGLLGILFGRLGRGRSFWLTVGLIAILITAAYIAYYMWFWPSALRVD